MATPRSAASDTCVVKIGVDADIVTPIAATLTADRALQSSMRMMLRSRRHTGQERKLRNLLKRVKIMRTNKDITLDFLRNQLKQLEEEEERLTQINYHTEAKTISYLKQYTLDALEKIENYT